MCSQQSSVWLGVDCNSAHLPFTFILQYLPAQHIHVPIQSLKARRESYDTLKARLSQGSDTLGPSERFPSNTRQWPLLLSTVHQS